jgi:hypothetical protein
MNPEAKAFLLAWGPGYLVGLVLMGVFLWVETYLSGYRDWKSDQQENRQIGNFFGSALWPLTMLIYVPSRIAFLLTYWGQLRKTAGERRERELAIRERELVLEEKKLDKQLSELGEPNASSSE